MMSTLNGSLGSRKTYRSVLSATGSWLISGASRWLEAPAGTPPATTVPSVAAAVAQAMNHFFRRTSYPLVSTAQRSAYGAADESDACRLGRAGEEAVPLGRNDSALSLYGWACRRIRALLRAPASG